MSIRVSLNPASSTSVFRETDGALDLMGNGVKAPGKQRFICFSLKHSFPHLARAAPSPPFLVGAEKKPQTSATFPKCPRTFTPSPIFQSNCLKKLLQRLENFPPAPAAFRDHFFCPCLQDNQFLPSLPKQTSQIIFPLTQLCLYCNR